MSDEGMFRPPGAPGSELRPSRPPGLPVPTRPAGDRAASEAAEEPTAGATGDSGAAGPGSGRTWHGVSPVTGWRLAGVGAAVAVYLAAGLPWYRIGVDRCVAEIGRADSASLRAACEHVALSGWQAARVGVLLALAAGAVMLVRLTRRGPVLLDLLAPLAAGLAGVLAVRALFDPADRQLDLAWPGPLTMLPLLAVLTVAGAQTYRLAHLAGVRSVGQAGARLREQIGDRTLRLPGWLRPASMWRHRRRWLVGAAVVFVALVLHGFAQQDPLGGLGNAPGVTGAQAGVGAGGGRGSGAATPSGSTAGPARPTGNRPPDGARLLTAARQAVAGAHTVTVSVDSLSGADVRVELTMTSDGRADGTVNTARNGYNVRRVGSRCWVQQLPDHPLLEWVPTCTIPAAGGTPPIDLAALTDWRVMVATLPTPAGARTDPTPVDSGVWRVGAADGSTVDVPAGAPAAGLPVRAHSARPRSGGATDIDYSGWNDPAAITPP